MLNPRTLATLVFILSMPVPATADPASVAGNWTTIDEKGRAGSVIAISVVGGVAEGTVTKIYKRPGDTGFCAKCRGDLKDKPLVGMKILTNLKPDGEVWDGGAILDPGSGDTYDVRMRPLDGGRKLQVRGFLGISLLGRTQVWVREGL